MRPLSGKVDSFFIESKALACNQLGDSAQREVLVYTPAKLPKDTAVPSLYVLPGFGSNHHCFVNQDPWKPNLLQRYERLLDSGEAKAAILVFADCWTSLGGSQFVNSPILGHHQDFLADEVTAQVQARYRVADIPEARGIVGRSSGGFGALRMGLERADRFRVIGSHAGDAAFEISLKPMLPKASVTVAQAGGVRNYIELIKSRGPKGTPDYDALFVLAALAAYAPLGATDVSFPMDERSARIDEDAWLMIMNHDPVEMASSHAEALGSLSYVFLDAGSYDEYALQFAARQVHDAWKAAGAPVEYDEFEGGHRGTSYRYDISLVKMIDAMWDKV